jgi:hypothetical protein
VMLCALSGLIGRLFASKLALACNSLVRFRSALDPILKLTVALGLLLGYCVTAAGCGAVYDIRRERGSLIHSKFMLCH